MVIDSVLLVVYFDFIFISMSSLICEHIINVIFYLNCTVAQWNIIINFQFEYFFDGFFFINLV